jgi:hypothetical protein
MESQSEYIVNHTEFRTPSKMVCFCMNALVKINGKDGAKRP